MASNILRKSKSKGFMRHYSAMKIPEQALPMPESSLLSHMPHLFPPFPLFMSHSSVPVPNLSKPAWFRYLLESLITSEISSSIKSVSGIVVQNYAVEENNLHFTQSHWFEFELVWFSLAFQEQDACFSKILSC